MANPIKRGQSGGQVSDFGSSQSAASFVSSITPYGLKLQQVITSTGSVTIPAGINFVYAICVGGGGAGVFNGYGGGAGGITWGWTIASPLCIVAAGATPGTSFGGYTRYGHLIAGGGGGNNGGYLGGASGFNASGSTNYWGVQSYGGSPGSSPNAPGQPTSGTDGVSGGGGGWVNTSGAGRIKGGNGGNGLAGGGGSAMFSSVVGTIGGGNGGNGYNIQTGQITLGGTGGIWSLNSTQGAGGGGAGTAGNGGSSGTGSVGGNGGLGGGAGGGGTIQAGVGGAGILYLYY